MIKYLGLDIIFFNIFEFCIYIFYQLLKNHEKKTKKSSQIDIRPRIQSRLTKTQIRYRMLLYSIAYLDYNEIQIWRDDVLRNDWSMLRILELGRIQLI